MHINKIIQYEIFCVWLLSPYVIFSRWFHVIVCISNSFFYWIGFHCMDIAQFIYPADKGHLGCFLFCYYGIKWLRAFEYISLSPGYITRNRISQLYKYMFNFIRNCQTGFQNSCTTLYFHHQHKRAQAVPPPR